MIYNAHYMYMNILTAETMAGSCGASSVLGGISLTCRSFISLPLNMMNSYVSVRGGMGLGTCRSSVPKDRTEMGGVFEVRISKQTLEGLTSLVFNGGLFTHYKPMLADAITHRIREAHLWPMSPSPLLCPLRRVRPRI